jgi:CHASE2 domain-containing sensor protein
MMVGAMQKKLKSTQERPVPKIEAKELFTTASAHTAVRNGFCIRLGQPWDAKLFDEMLSLAPSPFG